MDDPTNNIDAARRWVQKVVVGLNLCPFAADPLHSGRVRFVESQAIDIEQLLHELVQEVTLLDDAAAPADTTLIVIPSLLADFEDFLDIVAAAEELLTQIGHDGRHQLAHFHPNYQFAETEPDDPANLTNQSPLPIIQILRWEDVRRAMETHPNVHDIPRQNQTLLRQIGKSGVQKQLDSK